MMKIFLFLMLGFMLNANEVLLKGRWEFKQYEKSNTNEPYDLLNLKFELTKEHRIKGDFEYFFRWFSKVEDVKEFNSTLRHNIFYFPFNSNFGGKNGKVQISINEDCSLDWKLEKEPNGEYYAPLKAHLSVLKIDVNKKMCGYKEYLSTEEIIKIKKSNKSYRVYQEFDEYDILYRLVKNSNYLHLLDYYTRDLEYWGDIDHHITKKGTLFMLVRNARKIIKNGKNTYITMPLDAIEFNPVNNSFTDGKDNPLPLKYPKVWLKIFNIYHQNKSKEFIFIKEKSSLYKKPNIKSKSKKFLIKNDCALIVDRSGDGWYQLFFLSSSLAYQYGYVDKV